jgi:hypothetical protein
VLFDFIHPLLPAKDLAADKIKDPGNQNPYQE